MTVFNSLNTDCLLLILLERDLDKSRYFSSTVGFLCLHSSLLEANSGWFENVKKSISNCIAKQAAVLEQRDRGTGGVSVELEISVAEAEQNFICKECKMRRCRTVIPFLSLLPRMLPMLNLIWSLSAASLCCLQSSNYLLGGVGIN